MLWVTSGMAADLYPYRQQEAVMNHSLYSADRNTHLKIVCVGLLCATLVAFVGVFAHVSALDFGTAPLVTTPGHSTTASGQFAVIR